MANQCAKRHSFAFPTCACPWTPPIGEDGSLRDEWNPSRSESAIHLAPPSRRGKNHRDNRPAQPVDHHETDSTGANDSAIGSTLTNNRAFVQRGKLPGTTRKWWVGGKHIPTSERGSITVATTGASLCRKAEKFLRGRAYFETRGADAFTNLVTRPVLFQSCT